MKWSEMTPAQRNQIVAGKVMGVTEFQCDGGRLTLLNYDTVSQRSTYACTACGTVLTVTDYFREKLKLPEQHMIFIPRYSESMDAAWMIVESRWFRRDVRRIDLAYDTMRTDQEHLHTCALKLYDGRVVAAQSASMPWAICIAALHACGVEVKP